MNVNEVYAKLKEVIDAGGGDKEVLLGNIEYNGCKKYDDVCEVYETSILTIEDDDDEVESEAVIIR